MPLVSVLLFKNLVDFNDSLDDKNGNVSQLRKLDLMGAFNDYAKSVFPASNTADTAKMAGVAAFQGDSENVSMSFAQAWSNALGTYTLILATGMIPQQYLPTFMPQGPAILPGLISVQSVQDKISQVQILANAIDAWMHTGISTLTIPPSTVVPTPWM